MRWATLSLVLALVGCGDRVPEADGPGARSLDEAVAQADSARFDVGPGPDVGPGSEDLREPPPTEPRPAPSPAPGPRAEGAPPVPVGRAGGDATADGRFALLVGVSDYPGARDDLPSGAHDVAAMRALLVERYGFRPEHIRTLTDRDATRSAVRRAIARHLGRARTTALLYVSGHGVRLEGNLGRADDEREGRDEALYLWADTGGGALILDDEIGAWTDALRAEHVLVVLDACHSGTGARGVVGQAPPVKEVALDSVAAGLDPSTPWDAEGTGLGGPMERSPRTVLLAAARDREPAYAGKPGEPSLFTATLTRVLQDAPPGTSLAEAMLVVRGYVEAVSSSYGASHSPQVEGGRGLSLADLLQPTPQGSAR